jgi:type IV pilus assembly protein PilC
MTPSPASKHQFYTEMAKLLEAGFDIRKAAVVMADTRLPKQQELLLKDLNEGLDAGESITEAFARDARVISGLERSMIAAGERGGKLAPAFKHLAEYFGMVASARRELIKGMIYPMIVLHLGIFIGTVRLTITGSDRSAGEVAGSFVLNLLILYAAMGVLFFLGRIILGKASGNASPDRMINLIPWIGGARRNLGMARFCKVYHACLLAGIPMVETTRVSAQAARSGLIREAGDRLILTAREGTALGPQFMAEAAFPKTFARSYATGEEAGTLDTDMANWANLFQESAGTAMKTASVLIPKILYFFIMAFVAWKIIGFFTGYYAELDKIGD